MRKRVLAPSSTAKPVVHRDWLDLDRLAQVEITSEDPTHPIESALAGDSETGPGWRAAEAGEQTIRILFDAPTALRHVQLVFEEDVTERTQEFVPRWSADGGRTFRDVVRQQFHFSPPTTARQEEDYRVELPAVTALELTIVPEIGGGPAKASLRLLRLAG